MTHTSPRPKRLLLVVGRGAAVFSALILALSCARTPAPGPRTPEPVDHGGLRPGSSSELPAPLSGESVSPEAGSYGPGGVAILTASHMHMADQGRYPETAGDLLAYLPFLDSVQGFELGRSVGPLGQEVLTAERGLDHARATPILKGQEVTPTQYEGFDPPIGAHAGIERHVVVDIEPAETSKHLTRENITYLSLASVMFDTVQGELSRPPEEGGMSVSDPSVEAARTAMSEWEPSEEERELAYLIGMVGQASFDFTMNDPDYRPAETLAELAAYFGGMNPAAWVNPYTGAPMQAVPLEAPVAGDYTEIPSAEGVLIAFHFTGPGGLLFTSRVGFQGQHDPTAFMRMWGGEDIGLREPPE